jgi:hypothetical protein
MEAEHWRGTVSTYNLIRFEAFTANECHEVFSGNQFVSLQLQSNILETQSP